MACSIASHNNAANQLWLVRENYVSLLSEFDGLSTEEIVKRRDELLLQTNKIYKKIRHKQVVRRMKKPKKH